LVDAGDGTHQHRATAIETTAIHDVPQVFDVARIFADQVIGQFLDRCCHGMGAAFDDRLAPTADTDIGIDAQE
jgi:hypothetical protein